MERPERYAGLRSLSECWGPRVILFAAATWTQSLPDWIALHVAMLAFFGAVPRQIVSDNLRAGITKACFYEPRVNRTYADMAAHYDTAIIPARPYKPRDKAKVEVGVQVVQRWILARLRDRRFFSLAELEPGSPRTGGAAQRPADASVGSIDPTCPLRADRPSGAAASAADTL